MNTVAEALQPLWAHNRALLPPRKIRVLKCGGFYRAFFDGCGTTQTFGRNPQEAIKRLQFEEKYGHA